MLDNQLLSGGDGQPTLTAFNLLLESLLRQVVLTREGLPPATIAVANH